MDHGITLLYAHYHMVRYLKIMLQLPNWFPFQGIIFHTADKFKPQPDHLQSLLKIFSMFKIKICWDDTTGLEAYTEAVGIMYINCGKSIVCLLENKTIEKLITTFVTNMVF